MNFYQSIKNQKFDYHIYKINQMELAEIISTANISNPRHYILIKDQYYNKIIGLQIAANLNTEVLQ